MSLGSATPRRRCLPLTVVRGLAVGALTAGLATLSGGCGSDVRRYDRLMARGEALLEAGDSQDALAAFLEAQRVFPERRQPYLYVGAICESSGTPESGIPVLREAVALDDENRATYSFLLAVLQEQADDREGAEASYRDSIRLDPDFAPAYANLGQFLFTSRRTAEALELMAEAVRRFPENLRVRLQHAEILMRAGRIDEAERQVRVLLEGDDPPSQSHYLMGLIDLQRDRPNEARRSLERASELEADDPRVWYQLAVACERLSDDEGQTRALERFDALFRRALGERAER